jgi:DNA repair exonuclease SbcCD ATPase subunit
MNQFNSTIETRESGKYYVSRNGRVVKLDPTTNMPEHILKVVDILEQNDQLREQIKTQEEKVEQKNREIEELKLAVNSKEDTPKTTELVQTLQQRVMELEKSLEKEDQEEQAEVQKYHNLVDKNFQVVVKKIAEVMCTELEKEETKRNAELVKENEELLKALACTLIIPEKETVAELDTLQVAFVKTKEQTKNQLIAKVLSYGIFSNDFNQVVVKPSVEVYQCEVTKK